MFNVCLSQQDTQAGEMGKIKYEEAVAQIEDIVRRLENNEMDIDSLSDELKKAQRLMRTCKDKLLKAESDVNNILKDVE